MYTIQNVHGFVAQALAGSNAAPLAPLNLHRERERERKDKRTTAPPRTGERTAGAARHPPGRDRQRWTVSAPERIHPRQHQHSRAATRTDNGRTGGPPAQRERGRTGGQTDRHRAPRRTRDTWTAATEGEQRTRTRTKRRPGRMENGNRNKPRSFQRMKRKEKQQEQRENLQALFSQAKKARRERAKQCDIRTF